jgi:hypothetical protein
MIMTTQRASSFATMVVSPSSAGRAYSYPRWMAVCAPTHR